MQSSDFPSQLAFNGYARFQAQTSALNNGTQIPQAQAQAQPFNVGFLANAGITPLPANAFLRPLWLQHVQPPPAAPVWQPPAPVWQLPGGWHPPAHAPPPAHHVLVAHANMPQHHLLNVAGVLIAPIPGGAGVVMVRNRGSSRWAPVAGGRNHGESPFDTLGREWREEVGGQLPHMSNLRRYTWGSTGIYAGQVNIQQVPQVVAWNRETDAIGVFPVAQVRAMANGTDPQFTMRRCARGSTVAVLNALGI